MNQSHKDARQQTRGKEELNDDSGVFKKRENDKARSYNALTDVEKKLLPVLPVMVKSEKTGKSATVNCLLDPGCDSTLATKRLANLLELNEDECENTEVIMATSNNETKEKSCKIDFDVCCLDSNKAFLLKNVLCMNEIGKHNNPIGDSDIDLTKHAHLMNLNLPVLENKNTDFIIGCDYEKLFDVIEIRRDSASRLTAKLSPLGWFLIGCVDVCYDVEVNVPERGDSRMHIHNHYACLIISDGVEMNCSNNVPYV